MKRVLNLIAAVIDFVATSMMIIMVILVLLQVFARYVLQVSLPWTEELARYALIYIVFLGAAVAVREKRHIVISFLIDRCTPKVNQGFRVLAIIAMMLFIYGLVRGSLQMIQLTSDVTTGSLYWLKMSYVYMAIPIGSFFMAIYLIQNLLELFREQGRGEGGNQ